MLIVEDGTGKSDSQTYASVTTLRAYAKARGETLPSGEAACEILLIKAMERMRGLNYVGDRATKEQALDWPRHNVCIDGFSFSSTDLPRQLEQAQCALAIEAQRIDLLPTMLSNAKGPVTSETIGPISRTYANNGRVRPVPAIAKADALLRVLLKRSGLVAIRT
jgi:hypothetical protein